MLQINHLSGFGGAISLPFSGLTQKGYGYIEGAGNTSDLTLSYANVSAGSAPNSGDLVVWMVLGLDNSAQPAADLSGSGWTQSRVYADGLAGTTMLGKVVTSGDISSPATVVSAPTAGSAGMWVAYSFNGSISLTVNSLQAQYSAGSAPSSDTVDSSALTSVQYAITMSLGTGTDDVISLSWSGATPDIQFQRTNVLSTATTDIEWAVHLAQGGESVTISKGDDTNNNIIASGYFAVSEAA